MESKSELEKAARQALEALEWNLPVIEDYGDKEQLNWQHNAITALRQALEQPAIKQSLTTEQPAQQEPVAWINWCAATGKRSVSFECESELASEPLYAGITQNTQGHYSKFHSWFYSEPHRAKYGTDHPAYLAAQEAWQTSGDLKKYNYTNGYCTERTDLLAEQKGQQEPVATIFEGVVAEWNLPATFTGVLYTRPQARKPLTNLEGLKLAYNHRWLNNLSLRDAFIQGIRDAEAAHGIGEKMALGDYILCCECECKLIYDGDRGQREWWHDRWGKDPQIKCPDCETPKREPLTDEQINCAIAELGLNYFADAANNRSVLRELCRRAAHGIGGKK